MNKEVRTGSKTGFQLKFVGYQFDLKEGKVRPTPERWQALTHKIQTVLSGLVCPVQQFMCLIGLLTVTEKQVHLGRLHIRPIQLHLKNNWRLPEITRKGDTSPQVAPPPLKVVAGGKQCTTRSTITPTKTCSADIYRHIKRRVGTHLNERTARGTWSLPESRLHRNHLELKTVFLALKEFRDLC